MAIPKSPSSKANLVKIIALSFALFFLLHQASRFRFDSALIPKLEERADEADKPAVQEAPKQNNIQQSVRALNTPPPLSLLFKNIPKRPAGDLEETPSFTRPRTLTAIGFKSPDADETTLRIFTSGVNTGVFKRNFQVKGCLVGNDAYTVHVQQPTIYTCIVPRPMRKGEKISILLKVDDELLEAMKEDPVEVKGTMFEMEKGDLEIVEKDMFKRDESLQGKQLAVIRSDVQWVPELMEEHMDIDLDDMSKKSTGPRYELCLMTAMKEETYVLRDWALHHHRLGVDRIYIYDNEAPNSIRKMLKDLEFVEVVYWPFRRSQIQSDNHFMYAMKSRCEYAGFFDGDEYAFPGDMRQGALKRYVHLRVKEGFNHIQLNWVVMENGGYVKKPEGRLPDLYTRRMKEVKQEGKVIVDCDVNWRHHRIHALDTIGDREKGTWYWNKEGGPFPSTLEDAAMLVHYRYRSWEEWVHKVNQGRGGILGIGPQKKVTMEEPAKNYMDMNSSVEYTYFKERYNELMKGEDEHETEVVQWKNGVRCSRLAEEVCE